MLKDIVLALLGFTGDVIVENGGTFRLSDDFHLINRAELELINDIASIGFKYRKLKRHTEKSNHYAFSSGDHGSFLGFSLSNEIEKVLFEYENVIHVIEGKYKQDKGYTLLHLQADIHRHGMVIQFVDNLLDAVNKEELSGGNLLSRVHRATISGNPYVEAVMKKIFSACLSDYFNYLLAYIFYEDIKEEKGLLMKQLHDPSDIKNIEWPFYALQPENVPDFIQPAVISKILFMKNAVVTLKHEKTPDKYRLTDKDVEECTREFSSRRDFNVNYIHKVVEVPFLKLSKKLIDLLMGGCDLFGTFELIKDIFLMGNVELFSHFYESYPDISTGSTGNLRAANARFHNSMLLLSTHLSDTEVYAFKFVKDEEQQALSLTFSPGWPLVLFFNQGSLQYYTRIFSILFPISRGYFRLQRAAAVIQRVRNCNSILLKPGEAELGAARRKLFKLQMLCFEVTHVVFCLMSYLHLSTLPIHFADFVEQVRENVESKKDFIELMNVAHPKFIQNVAFACFANMKVINKALASVLKTVDRFCDYVNIASGNIVSLQEPKVDELKNVFRRELSLFISLITQLNAVQGSQQLSSLIHSINYSEWLEQA